MTHGATLLRTRLLWSRNEQTEQKHLIKIETSTENRFGQDTVCMKYNFIVLPSDLFIKKSQAPNITGLAIKRHNVHAKITQKRSLLFSLGEKFERCACVVYVCVVNALCRYHFCFSFFFSRTYSSQGGPKET